jgi:hypothetical protein
MMQDKSTLTRREALKVLGAGATALVAADDLQSTVFPGKRRASNAGDRCGSRVRGIERG